MAQLTEKTVRGDVVKWTCHDGFCVEKHLLKAATAASIEVGSPLKDDTGDILIVNGDEDNVECIALENIEAAGGETISVLIRGPAIIDPDKLHLETGVTWAELAAALAALDIRPAKGALADWSTQTD